MGCCKKKETINADRMDSLREASGEVTYSDPLTSFLYELMRDEVPVGVVERIVGNVVDYADKDQLYSNGWLAKYARNLAETLQDAKEIKLRRLLSKAFREEEISRKVPKNVRPVIKGGEVRYEPVAVEDTIGDDALSNLKNIVEEEDKKEDGERRSEMLYEDEIDELEQEIIEKSKHKDSCTRSNSKVISTDDSIRVANEFIEKLKLDGRISDDEFNKMKEDLVNAVNENDAKVDEKEIEESDVDNAKKDISFETLNSVEQKARKIIESINKEEEDGRIQEDEKE